MCVWVTVSVSCAKSATVTIHYSLLSMSVWLVCTVAIITSNDKSGKLSKPHPLLNHGCPSHWSVIWKNTERRTSLSFPEPPHDSCGYPGRDDIKPAHNFSGHYNTWFWIPWNRNMTISTHIRFCHMIQYCIYGYISANLHMLEYQGRNRWSHPVTHALSLN